MRMSDALPQAALSYDQAKQQINTGAMSCIGDLRPEAINALLPVVSYKKSTFTVELAFIEMRREAFFSVVDVLAQYYRYFTEFRRSAFGATLVGDHHSPIDRKFAERRKEKDGQDPPLIAPTKITIRFDSKGGGMVVFEKDGLLLQEEINCIIDVFRKCAARNDEPAVVASPAQKLAELGAVVFESSDEFRQERIAGYEATKREVRETIVLPLLHPEIFLAVGEMARSRPGPCLPRAVLFEGPPGTGKTTMARVIASESAIPLVYLPVESIMSKWYGESERRLEAIFSTAATLPKSIVFLDEIDAFAGSRERAMHESTRRILSVLLRQLQGLVDRSNVVVIGATNRKTDLDPALLSRFDLFVRFPLPNPDERAKILGYYAKHLDADAIRTLVDMSEGRAGRELEDACGVAERMWASQIIATGACVTPPPVDIYAAAFRLKFR